MARHEAGWEGTQRRGAAGETSGVAAPPRLCLAIRDINEHVYGSFIIEPGTLAILGRACMFCGEPQEQEENS